MRHRSPAPALALLVALAAACSARAHAPLTSGAGAACEVVDAGPPTPPPRPAPSARDVRRALLAAAAMDPACWHLDWSGVGELDVTTALGSYSSNSLGVHFGDPDIWAEDAYPGARSAGANRLADARNALWIPAGTRIRSAGCRTCSDDPKKQWRTQLSYVWRCEPDSLAARPRYADPIALLEERETALEALPLHHVIIEAIGGGSVTQDLHRDVPCSPPGIVVVYAGTLDGSWLTISTAAGRALHRPPLPGRHRARRRSTSSARSATRTGSARATRCSCQSPARTTACPSRSACARATRGIRSTRTRMGSTSQPARGCCHSSGRSTAAATSSTCSSPRGGDVSDRDDSDPRTFQSGNRTPSDLRARVVTTAPEGIPIVIVEDPARPRSDTGERIAAAVADARADANTEHRFRALEASNAWLRRGLVAIGMAALASLGSVIAKIWSAAEATTTERLRLERAIDELRELRDEVRMMRRSSDLLPDRAAVPVANLTRTP